MLPFQAFSGIAAPLPIDNVDTDKIIPARFLTTISRNGLGASLLASLRDDPEFVLNLEPWTEAQILVGGDNFGCGSSREHAPWALLDFGIRCVIAPRIADIFYNNCFKNGILPILLAADEVTSLMELATVPDTACFRIDLEAQTIETDIGTFAFAIEPKRKQDLLDGHDEIASTFMHVDSIDAFERDHETLLSASLLQEVLGRLC